MKLVYNKSTKTFSNKTFASKPTYYVMINNKALETSKTLDTINKAITSCTPDKKLFYIGKGYDPIEFESKKDALEYESLMKEYIVVKNGFREIQLDKELKRFKPSGVSSILKKI